MARPAITLSVVDAGLDLAQQQTDAVVVGVHSSPRGPKLAAGATAVDRALGGRLLEALRAVGATGRPDEVVKIPTLGQAPFPLVVATGLGSEGSDEALRRGVGAAARALLGTKSAHVAIDGSLDAIAEGVLFGAYAFTDYKSSPRPAVLRAVSIAGTPGAESRAVLKHARIVADAITVTRDLVNTPPNELYPETFAERTADIGTAAGLDVEVLDERALRRGSFGGVVAVGSGSARPPRLVRLTYRPAKPRARIALVGKGITYDSGGLNLKTANLTWMKSDMGGAAAVIATVVAAKALRLPVELIATLPMAENMPSGSSYRPSDILRMRDGRTVEVADTDAEGRLILGDAIARAAEDEPDYLLEASTLTAGQLVALGTRVIGAMGQPELRDLATAAGNRVGESVWAMPLPEDLRAGLDSAVADLTNLPPDRWGSMLVGGRFLAEFVPAGLPWVHLDIHGPAWNNSGARDYTPKGATGAAVRTLIATVEELARR